MTLLERNRSGLKMWTSSSRSSGTMVAVLVTDSPTPSSRTMLPAGAFVTAHLYRACQTCTPLTCAHRQSHCLQGYACAGASLLRTPRAILSGACRCHCLVGRAHRCHNEPRRPPSHLCHCRVLFVVRRVGLPQHPHCLPRPHRSADDACEGVKPVSVRARHHLDHVRHQRPTAAALPHGLRAGERERMVGVRWCLRHGCLGCAL